MSEFRDIDIRKLDGGLLLVFRELVRRRSARETGLALGLSQPAVSHALARLRDLFGDPLFIRRPHGLDPTRRALELGPRIEALIELAGAAIAREGGFDAGRSDRIFTVGGYDSVQLPFAPILIAAINREAPRVTIRFVDMMYWQAASALQRGEIDLAIGQFGELPAGMQSAIVLEDDYCIIARKGHPQVHQGRITPSAYREIGHVFTSHPVRRPGDAWDMSDAIALYGTLPDRSEVRALAYVPRFTMAMMLCATSDAISDIPRSLAEPLAARMGLDVLEMPFEWPGFQVDAVRREAGDPGVDWLWGHILAAARTSAPSRAKTRRQPRRKR